MPLKILYLLTGGKGIYAAIDAVGGETTKQVSLALRDGGTVYVYGALAGGNLHVDTLDTLYKYKRVEVSTWPAWLLWQHKMSLCTSVVAYVAESV